MEFYIKINSDTTTGFTKYDFVIKFAHSWLKILDSIISNNQLDQFIKDIDGYSLIGENIDMEEQHIKLYKENQIQFYSLVKNDETKVPEISATLILS